MTSGAAWRLGRAALLGIVLAIGATAVARAQSIPAQGFPDTALLRPPPPLPRRETPPPSPGEGFTWMPGRWAWDGAAWRWAHGRWRSSDMARGIYVPGHWQNYAGHGTGWTPGTMR